MKILTILFIITLILLLVFIGLYISCSLRKKDNYMKAGNSGQSGSASGSSSDIDYTLGTTYDYSNYNMLYSIRRLTTNTEYCMKVVRDDDETLHIGFKDGLIDSDALAEFCSDGQSLYVTDWYDQSGNGHTLSRITKPGPRIAWNGDVHTSNGHPCIFFYALNSYAGDPQALQVSRDDYKTPSGNSYNFSANFVLGGQNEDPNIAPIIGNIFSIDFYTDKDPTAETWYKFTGVDSTTSTGTKVKSKIRALTGGEFMNLSDFEHDADYNTENQQVVQNVFEPDNTGYDTTNNLFIGGTYVGRYKQVNTKSIIATNTEPATVTLGSSTEVVAGKVQEITVTYESEFSNISDIYSDIKKYI